MESRPVASNPIFCVDAFADRPFKGNPAAVALLTDEASADWMQSLAAELALSETAFLMAVGEGRYRIRWFTPTCEIDLCGHATLASAHVLYERARVPDDRPITFEGNAHTLTAGKSGHRIGVDLPRIDPARSRAPEGLLPALGLRDDGRPVYRGGGFWLVEVGHESEVAALSPDLTAVAKLGGTGVIVTARSSEKEADIVSRVFAPAVGIDEDPVTGSAHCLLGPYWAPRFDDGGLLKARQLSKRGGDMLVRLVDDETVRLTGGAVTIWEGIVRA